MFRRMTSSLPKKAAEFPDGSIWLNTDRPLSQKDLRGHIVVMDFWTYCCINCMHTIADLEWIENKYRDQPVVIIGIHSAKFYNEQDAQNIKEAVGRYELRHPVIVDQNMKIWKSYDVSGWPTLVVIDPRGNIVYQQAGEGQRDDIDDVITVLLERSRQQGVLSKEPLRVTVSSPAPGRVLSYPGKLALSPDGKKMLAISDSNHNRILIVDAVTGKVSSKVGSGDRGLQDGDYSSAKFFRPQGLAWVSDKIYVADTENHALREIDMLKKTVRTLVGDGKQGAWISSPSMEAQTRLSSPWDVAHKDGVLFIAMAGLHQIWAYEIESGKVGPYAGSGYEGIVDGSLSQAQFAQPSGLSLCDNSLFVADSEVSAVRRIDLGRGKVETILGRGLFEFGHKDGMVHVALMQHPLGLSCAENKVFVADTYNHAVRFIDRKVGTVYTVVGKAEMKTMCNIDDPACDTLGLYEPSDVKLQGNTLFISDTNNHLIRTFDLDTRVMKTLPVTD